MYVFNLKWKYTPIKHEYTDTERFCVKYLWVNRDVIRIHLEKTHRIYHQQNTGVFCRNLQINQEVKYVAYKDMIHGLQHKK